MRRWKVLAAALLLWAAAPTPALAVCQRFGVAVITGGTGPTTRPPSIRPPQIHLCDREAELLTADVAPGDLAFAKDTAKLLKRTSSAWVEVGGAGGGAPTTATYHTQTPDAGLSAEQAWSLLTTGLVLNTTGTGAASIYGGTTAGANEWINALSASGVGTFAQPAFSNLSGAATDAQVPDTITISLAAAATALAADPANCAVATEFSVGVTAAGVASCEAIADADVPNTITIDLATLATTATTANAGDSATAFFSSGTIEVARGGTGSAPASDDQVLVSDSTSAATWRSVPDCGEAGTLNYTASSNTFSCLTDSGGAGATNFVETSIAITSIGMYFTATVTGQTWVTTSSVITCSVLGTTADGLTPETIAVAGVTVTVANRVAGTGYDLLIGNSYGLEGTIRVHCVGA